MRKIREVLRLKFEVGLSARQVAVSLRVVRASVGDYLNRFAASGLIWPSVLTDAQLQRSLFPPSPAVPSDQRPMPDWAWAHAELRRPGFTLALLWQEYRLTHPQGFQYSWFCEHYRLWAAKVDVVMRQEHRAGEKLFVDYAGQTAPIIDRQTGEIRQAQIFVAVLGASSYTFAEATWSQKLPDWLGSHARCFAYFGGTSQILAPDNLRSGVTKAHRYEPDISPNHLERRFNVTEPNKVWVTDITYIRTYEGWLFLAVVLDLFSRQVIGWSMKSQMTSDLAIDALLITVWRRKPKQEVIHSDQGSQFSSGDWQSFLKPNNLLGSMSRRGNWHDNAVAESFFQLLKRERIKRKIYSTKQDARGDMFDYIEMFYNPKRRHGFNNQLSPVEFEKRHLLNLGSA